MAVTRTNTVTITATQLKLGDLRDFVADLQGQPDNLSVNYNTYAGDQRDPSTLTLSVLLPGRAAAPRSID